MGTYYLGLKGIVGSALGVAGPCGPEFYDSGDEGECPYFKANLRGKVREAMEFGGCLRESFRLCFKVVVFFHFADMLIDL